jgi:hypothetical protein
MARNRKSPPEQSIIPKEILRAKEEAWSAHEEAWRRGHEAWLQGALRVCEEAAEKYGYAPAVMDALKLCIDFRRPLPDWLATQIWGSMAHLFNKPKNRKKFDLMTAHRGKHLTRWDAVTELRERRE